MDNQGELFDVRTPPTAPPRMAAPPRSARYARYKPRTRTLCDDCVAAIHRLGQARAPYPARVAWRRTDVDGTVALLCHGHADERRGRE